WANNGDLISREYAGTSALKGDYTGRGKSYKEKVIILTKKALYVCTFHYRLEKVMQFQRIGLGEITYEYILSTLYPSCASPEDNYDFVVYYQASGAQRFMAFKAFRSNLVGEATKFDGGGSCGY
ncbi:8049_t:CDS:2, partial [Entrophospora sp. SA101]